MLEHIVSPEVGRQLSTYPFHIITKSELGEYSLKSCNSYLEAHSWVQEFIDSEGKSATMSAKLIQTMQ